MNDMPVAHVQPAPTTAQPDEKREGVTSNVQTPEFEIGLALAGAVSAGSYTAGVLDFLFEALDAWHARADCPHRVNISVISGASAGALVGAIAATAARSRFPPVRPNTPDATRTANPLYDASVNRIDVVDLLKTTDIEQRGGVFSVLNADHLDAVAEHELAAIENLARVERGFISDPLRLRFTVTNLRGVPYAWQITGTVPQGVHAMSDHADAIRFAITGAGTATGSAPHRAGDWKHERTVQNPWSRTPDERRHALWEVCEAALASAAFPIALRPRRLIKRHDDYSGTRWPYLRPMSAAPPARRAGR